ncbi:HSP20-like chaperone [Dipodascopsis tothii]|uniref:HSP20-like chaperone n=1 Tax=Dipodascopsis tothii TaxID=44089 RepID=UPI0034CE9CAA
MTQAPDLVERLQSVFDVDPFFTSAPASPFAINREFFNAFHSLAGFTHTRPSFDIRETEAEFLLEGDFPGIAREDIELEFLDENTLRVKGRIRAQSERASSALLERAARTPTPVRAPSAPSSPSSPSSTGSYWAKERFVGQYSRTFRFPSPVDTGGVSARLKNGVLRIVVPKLGRPPAAVRKVEIVAD